MADTNGIAVAKETNDAEPVRPVGFAAFARWVVPRLQKGLTIKQMVAEYPDDITEGSFQAKLSKFRKQAEKAGLQIPRTARQSRAQNVDVAALAAELNLSLLTQESETETETETQA